MDLPARFSFISVIGLCIFFFTPENYAQTAPQPGYFALPVDIPVFLSGNFGELRATHFHAGIDIKTQQVIGKTILASADGYVSRVRVQATGYGKSLYIMHPNGYSTVYAHLESFSPIVDRYVTEQQYRSGRFEVDLYTAPGQFLVKKGEIIGLSGNSGSSGGPHLHFEIRDANQRPLNPLQYYNQIPDRTKPVILTLAVYPASPSSLIHGTHRKLLIMPEPKGGRYIHPTAVDAFGEVGFGIDTYDLVDGSANKCGVYAIRLFVNGILTYEHIMDRLSFDKMKYINSHADYEEKMQRNAKIHRLFPEPNNRLDIYKTLINNGVVIIEPDSLYQVRFEAEDVKGNTSIADLRVKGIHPAAASLQTQQDSGFLKMFYYDRANRYADPEFNIEMAANGLFNHIRFTYMRLPGPPSSISDTHLVHNDLVAVATPYTISLKVKNPPEGLEHKLLIAYADRSGKTLPFRSLYKDGFVNARVNRFGRYFIGIDTLPPVIKPLTFRNNARYRHGDILSFDVRDDFSGIDLFEATINGSWALLEHDPKNNLMFYQVDIDRLDKTDEHMLRLIVTDERGNRTSFSGKFLLIP